LCQSDVILRTGGLIAQVETPAHILASPADEFVASFVGADRGKRALHLESRPDGEVLVDTDGRLAGVLVENESRDKAGPFTGSGASAQGGDPR